MPNLFEAIPERQETFLSLFDDYQSHIGEPCDPMRVLQFMYNIGAANEAEPDDYLKLGTHKGLTARIIYKLMDQNQDAFLLGAYEGLEEIDLVVERNTYASPWHKVNFDPTSPEYVAAYVGGGVPPDNVKPIKDWFPDTYAGLEDRRWRFAHIDFDFYQPICSAMNLIWPQLVPGGVMMVHDYGCFGFPGGKIAVDKFSEHIGMVPTHFGGRWGSIVLIKSKKPLVQ